jgi:polyphosphate kinase
VSRPQPVAVDIAEAPPAARFVNRELSWLAFNERVLEEAIDPRTPLIERMRFLTIFHTNLDEFFMVRVSGLRQQVAAGVEVLSIDGLSPRAQLSIVLERSNAMAQRAQRVLHDDVLPALQAHGVHLVDYTDLSPDDRARMDDAFMRRVYPILTPLAVGPTHPFPFISNLSLNLAVFVESPEGERRLARVKVPLANLPRLVRVDGHPEQLPVRWLPVEQLIAANLQSLFPGMALSDAWVFRVTRDADLEIREDEADDLLDTLQQELRKRRFGDAVRLEVEEAMPDAAREALRDGLGLEVSDVVGLPGYLGVPRLSQILSIDLPGAKYPPYVPRRPAALPSGADLFAAVRHKDVLLHHPYETFAPVVEFIRSAARDPAVVAIKQTLYRTSGDSPVIRALEEAIENGKQVAAVVELKARFDEENNIVWARRLEEAGVHVIYGVPGLKTHSKVALVVRREGDELVRYAHIGTGNYNPNTARIYSDLGLLTAHPGITADVADLFNRLTGFARPTNYRHLYVAPSHMKDRLLERIAHEAAEARRGQPARVIAKCNAITDRDIIEALYEASAAGVEIDLLVRGICCLLPGVPRLSERIRVRSVVGRFLEHDRIYWFHRGGKPVVYIGSADWMDRNLERRVEVLTPVLDTDHADYLRKEVLQVYLDDTVRTRRMRSDGTYERVPEGLEPVDVHQVFMERKP